MIGAKFVLTAAHCICCRSPWDCDNTKDCILNETWKANSITYVMAGDHDDTKKDVGEKKIRIVYYVPHEDWNGID